MTQPLSVEQREQRRQFIAKLRQEYSAVRGAVYLDHFDAEIGNADNPRARAQHYTGFVEGRTAEEIAEALERRNLEHATGRGARIMAAVVAQGVSWRPAKIWRFVSKAHELDLKEKYKNARALCPICRGEIEIGDAPVVIDAGAPESDDEPLPEVELSAPCWSEYQAMRRGTGLAPRQLSNKDDGFIEW